MKTLSNELPREKILDGAKNMLTNCMHLGKDDEILIITPDRGIRMTEYLVNVAQQLGMEKVIVVMTPENLRPYRKFPKTIETMVTKADGVIMMLERMGGEILPNEIQRTCIENNVKYTYIVDPEPRYFGGGINCDVEVVAKKTMKIGELCTKAKEVHVTSKIGSDVQFQCYDYWVPCVPELTPEIKMWNQLPEGEAQMCPVEETFNGTVVTRGPFRYAAQGLTPILLRFKRGRIVEVGGDVGLQERLLARIRELDPTIDSLLGIYVGEFAVGSNDWTVLDDNVSNCEKVSGTIHFALGSRDSEYMRSCREKHPDHLAGIDRGEKFHLDFMVTTPSVVVTKKNGEKIKLIKEGIMQI